MDIRFLSVLLLSLCTLGLGILVYLKNPNNSAHRAFALFTFSVTLWSTCLALTYYGITDRTLALAVGRMTFAAASLIPYGFLLFARSFPAQDRYPSNVFLRALGMIAIGFVFLSLSPWIVSGVQPPGARIQPVYGPLYPLFAAYFLLCLGLGLFVLARKLKHVQGLAKLQLRYLFLGLLIACTGATTTNLIIPLVFGTSLYGGYGPFFVLVLISFCAHAIIRYRLMDIKVFIRKGVVYVCAIAIAVSVFLGIAVLLNALTGYQREYVPLGVAVVVAVLVAILFQPVKKWVQDSFNRYLYRQPWDYQRTVREASRRLSTILDLRSLLNYLAEVIRQTLKVEMVAVYLREQTQHVFTAKVLQRFAEWDKVPSTSTLATTSALVGLLEQHKRTLACDESPPEHQDHNYNAAVAELQSIGGEIAFPIVQDQLISGIVVVGPKLSGDPYFPDDLDLLATLVSQAGIAIKNAQLYGEIVLANEYIRNTLANIESGVVAVDAEGSVTLFNPAAERLMGPRAGALRGGSAGALPPALAHTLIATLGDGEPRLHVESVIPDAGRGPIPIVLNTSPLADDDGRLLGAVVVFSDVTKLKELEAEQRRAERLAAWSALAAGIAHEIKNPLVAIKTFAELLPERYTDVDFRVNFSNVAIKEIERIDALVGRLRGLGAPATRNFHPLDLRQPIDETLALLAGQLEQKRISVAKEYADALPPVPGDPSQLKQLFLNVFMNSLDAMESGGQLTIRLTTRSGYGQDTVRVEVRDSGKGIPEELLDKMFNPFVTTKIKGGGLGLAICQGITDAHHATIRAENNSVGRGATLMIEFPAAAESPVPVHA